MTENSLIKSGEKYLVKIPRNMLVHDTDKTFDGKATLSYEFLVNKMMMENVVESNGKGSKIMQMPVRENLKIIQNG